MNDLNVDKLIRSAEEKYKLLEKFLELTRLQAQTIDVGKCEFLLDLINQKQTIIERVNILNLDLEGKLPENNDTLKDIRKKTKVIMAEAIAMDKKNIKILKENQALIFEKLQKARKNKITHNTYRGKNLAMEGILLDYKK